MNDDSISENDLEKMIQGLSNQTYGSTVEDHAGNGQDTSDDDSSGQAPGPDPDIAEEISVSEALRRKEGYVKIKGQVIGYSEIYNMVYEVTISCSNCAFSDKLDYSKKPVFRSPVKEMAKCPRKVCGSMGQTLMANMRYTTAMHIDVQDPEKFSEIERIKVRLFEDNTRDIFAGKLVTITGNLHVVRENDNPNNKLVTVLYAESINDVRKQQQELTQKDIDDILAWKRSIEDKKGCLVEGLVSYFAPHIVGYKHVKKGLLMVAANAGIPNNEKRNPKRLRLNALLIGDPSLAKSTFLNKIVEVVPNARYESCQSSTGLSLTAQVSKEEGGIYTLRHGPIPLANGSICALNEIGQMHIFEHKHFLDCMQEGRFTLNKYGFNAPIITNTSIVASANPINNTWKDPNEIQQSEFPTLTQIVHRFDFIFIFIENIEPGHLRDYTRLREEIAKKSAQGAFDDYDNFLRKYLMYARTFDPTISAEAREMLDEYWINMGLVGVRGLPRKLESLESAAIALAKLKLKDVVEADDVTEIMEFYNLILLHFRQSAAVSRNPRDIVYEECVDVLKSSKFAISYEEIIKSAMYARLTRVLGNNTGISHGTAVLRIAEDEKWNYASILAKRLIYGTFMSPTTVATVDQLLLSIFNWRHWEMIEQNASNAAIIFDEIHAYDFYTIALISHIIKSLSRVGGSRFAFLSATLPNYLTQYLTDILTEHQPRFVEDKQFKQLVRHRISFFGMDIGNATETIISQYRIGKKILVILNTVDSAIDYYLRIKNFLISKEEDTSHLVLYHSRFIERDRRKKEIIIKKAPKQKNGFIAVTTQVVEVSLNIDYDMLFTQVAPIDALVQRFGRVNRKGMKSIFDDGNIMIYNYGHTDHKIYGEANLVKAREIVEADLDKKSPSESLIRSLIDKQYPVENTLAELKKEEKYVNTDLKMLRNDLWEIQTLLLGDRDNALYKIARTRQEKVPDIEIIPSIYENEISTKRHAIESMYYIVRVPLYKFEKCIRYHADSSFIPVGDINYSIELGATGCL